jgi:hypothetical protein
MTNESIICDICCSKAFYIKTTQDQIWMYKFYVCENCDHIHTIVTRVKRK